MTRAFFVFPLWIVAVVATAWGQVAITGQIRGAVSDPTGAVIPNATIVVTSPSLMGERKTTSQANGSYLFDQLPPGTYEITLSAPGFQSYAQRRIVITAGFTATVNATLQLGGVAQTVEVTGAPPWLTSRASRQRPLSTLDCYRTSPAAGTPGPRWRKRPAPF